MNHDRVVIRAVNAVDIVNDEGWISLQVLAAKQGKGNVRACNVIAARELRVLIQLDRQILRIVREGITLGKER